MSDTPRTDAACGWPWGHHGRIECGDLRWSPDGPFVHSAVARELERENQRLKQTVLATLSQRGQKELIVAWDRVKELECENAALRKDKERLDWLEEQSDNMGWLHQCRYSSIRSAIDAARKEAQS